MENSIQGKFEKDVQIPTTIEDADVINVARGKIKECFDVKGKDLHKARASL